MFGGFIFRGVDPPFLGLKALLTKSVSTTLTFVCAAAATSLGTGPPTAQLSRRSAGMLKGIKGHAGLRVFVGVIF